MQLNGLEGQNQLINRGIPFTFLLVFVGLMAFTFFFEAYLLAFLVFGPIVFALAWFFYGYLRVKPFHIPLKLMFLVGYGGVFIIFATLILNQLGALNALVGILLIDTIVAPELWLTILSVVVVAPLVEEFTKALPNMLFFWSKERSVSGVGEISLGERKGMLYSEYRGVFFGIMTGAIFTVLETYLYVFVNLPAFEITDLFQYWFQVVLRSGAPVHIGGAMLTGYSLGKSDRLRQKVNSRFLALKTFFMYYILAVMLHLTWNGSSVLFSLVVPDGFAFDIASLAVFAILGILVYVIGFKLMKNSLDIAKDFSSCERCDLKYSSELESCPHCVKNLKVVKQVPSEMGSYKFCVSCNEKYPITDDFCKKCGQTLSSVKEIDTQSAEKRPQLLTISTLLMLMLNILLGFALVLGGYLLVLLAATTGISGAVVLASFALLIGILSFAGVLGVFFRWYSGWYISILFAITIVATVILVASFGVGFLIITTGLTPLVGLALGLGGFVVVAILLILFFVFTKEEDFLTMRFSVM